MSIPIYQFTPYEPGASSANMRRIGVPFHQYVSIPIPANTTDPTMFDCLLVDPIKTLLIATISAETGADATVSRIEIDDSFHTGQWLGPNTFHRQQLLEVFGDFFVCQDSIRVRATNVHLTEGRNAQMNIYGFLCQKLVM